MTRRRRRRGGGSRCSRCQRPVLWLTWAHAGRFPFDPKPVSHTGQHAIAHPVEGGTTAWRYRELVEDLMVRRQCSQTEAEAEAHDMPWHVPHTCLTSEGGAT